MTARPLLVLLTAVALVTTGLLDAGRDPAGPRDLQQVITDWQSTAAVDGVVVALAHPGEAPRSLTAGRAVPADRFRIGSVTKTFVAATVLRLVEEGVLSLDDRLDRWLDEPARFSEVTVRQLLGHTSGIPEYVSAGDLLSQLDRRWTPEQMIALTTPYTPDFMPGAGWQYSNTNYLLLGQIIEAATSLPYGTVMDDLVLGPTGIQDTTGTDLEVTLPGWFDIDHDGTPDDVSDDPFLPTLPWASGQMVSTGADLAAFMTELMAGDLLTRGSLEEMLRENPFHTRYGLGVQWSTPDGRTQVVGHSGAVIGYMSVAWWVPDLDLAIVVLVNDSGHAAPADLAELVLRHELARQR